MHSNKRSIPEIRKRLLEIAKESNLPEIEELVSEMYRRSPVARAKSKSRKLTPGLARRIRRRARQDPTKHQREIAEEFDVNPGRVSEALNKQI